MISGVSIRQRCPDGILSSSGSRAASQSSADSSRPARQVDCRAPARGQVPVISEEVSIRQRSPDGPSLTEEASGGTDLCRFELPGAADRFAGADRRVFSANSKRQSSGMARRAESPEERRAEATPAVLPARRSGARHLGQLESAENHASARRGGRERSLPIRVAWRSGPIHRAAPAAACARSHGVQLAKRRLARGRLCSSERGARALATDLCRFESAARGGRLYDARVHRTRYGRLDSAEMHASATSARPEGLLRPTMRRSGRVAEAAPGRSSLPEGRAARSKSPQDLCDSNGQRSRESSETRTIVRARRCGATRSAR